MMIINIIIVINSFIMTMKEQERENYTAKALILCASRTEHPRRMPSTHTCLLWPN